ncbi:MAG: AlkA N-terminal domain-containing protein, partial [Mycobacteriales bacterium]
PLTAPHHSKAEVNPSTAVSKQPQTLIPVTLRLAFRAPLATDELWGFLAARAITGVEHGTTDVYRRTLQLPHGVASIELHRPNTGQSYLWCTLSLTDLRDLTTAVRRCRRLLDLDADPIAVAQALSSDPGFAATLRRAPGLRLPGACDPVEYAIRAVIGQQISVAAARTVTARICARYGTPVTHPDAELTHMFPTPQALTEADPADLPMPGARKRTLRTLCTALADGTITMDAGSDPAQLFTELTELPGIGPWTANYIAMRGLGAPDVFLETDLGVLRGAAALGLPVAPRELLAHAQRWRPWRSYAVLHLWHATSNTNAKEAAQ